MAEQDEDDPALDWGDAGATVLDDAPLAASDAVTAPHDVSALAEGVETEIAKARDAGCKTCWPEAQEDAMAALRSVLLERGLTNEEAANLVLLVRGRLTAL